MPGAVNEVVPEWASQDDQNLGNHPKFLDSGDDFQFAPGMRPVFDVDTEYPFQLQSGQRGFRHVLVPKRTIWFFLVAVVRNVWRRQRAWKAPLGRGCAGRVGDRTQPST